MRRTRALLTVLLLLSAIPSLAQVLSPVEIAEPGPRALQQKYLADLRAIGAEIQAQKFPYPFYLSRKLDLDEAQQRRVDQRSIRFDKFNYQTVLEITGNYYAAYSAELMGQNQRARQTFLDIMLPMLKAAVPRFAGNESVQGYALEVSHHVRRKVLGVPAEHPENLALVLPRTAAERLVKAKDTDQQQGALLEGQAFLDGEPIALWLNGDPPPEVQERVRQKAAKKKDQPEGASLESSLSRSTSSTPMVSPNLVKSPDWPARIISPDTLSTLQAAHQDVLARMVREMDQQAHFVSYAPPVFIAFHQGVYLQLSITTTLEASAGGPRYKLAALAFDDHISHLVRPMLNYFPKNPDFDGLDLSTTVRIPGSSSAPAVEFFFPFPALRCFAGYECTGQQLINAGFVLINGERAGLDLQTAEATH